MTDTLDYVKFYAQKGWDIFPLPAKTKIPQVRWPEVASHEENMVMGWWDTDPSQNVGIVTGKRSGIVVIDIDPKNGGYESLAELQVQHGALPATPVARTGGGGEHLFFAHPNVEVRNSAGRIGPGIDVRGDGGYVVGAPSVHPNGERYEWVVKPSETPLAPLPDWILDVIKDPTPNVPVVTNGMIYNGQRNQTLTSIAGSMRRRGLDEDDIFKTLMSHNQKYCNPPLREGEVLVIAKSIARYEPAVKVTTPLPPLTPAGEILEELRAEILERAQNPVDVWGIPYAWNFISLVTGGKQKGELVILAGEPGAGKSWWSHQDAMQTAISGTPVFLWSGEMKRKQVFKRMMQMMGVPKRHMMTGNMTDADWQIFNEANAILMNVPLYVSDVPLDLDDLRPLLEREVNEHGIQQVVLDYDWLINAPGKDEIQQSQNISRTCKQLATELNLAFILISSVNKMGMENDSASKAIVSGSGKKLHDADVIYILTKFNERKNADLSIKPDDYSRIATLHIAKGRELDYHVPNKAINYERERNTPKFVELHDDTKPLPAWMDRKDLA